MAVERIELFAGALLAGGRPADTPVMVVQRIVTSSSHCQSSTMFTLTRLVAPGTLPNDGKVIADERTY